MKVASWNVNSLRVRLPQVLHWLKASKTDVLCLQETKLPDDDFPLDEFTAAGYHAYYSGQKTYNGTAIISRHPAEKIETGLRNFSDPQKRLIQADIEGMRIINVYVPNGQALDSDKFIYKRQWFQALRHHITENLNENVNLLLLGDFNITPTDMDVHDPKQWQDKIHCSTIERLMLHKLMATGLYDTFRHIHPQTQRFSWWDYRGGGYKANEGLRIDLLLSSGVALNQVSECDIDESPRQQERPSDHTPVWVVYSSVPATGY